MRKKLLSVLVPALLAAACSTPPTAGQLYAIQTACGSDAALRPTVSILLSIPGLATPQEVAGIAAARAIIDPICADPGAPVGTTAAQSLAGAAGQVAAYVVAMQARQQR